MAHNDGEPFTIAKTAFLQGYRSLVTVNKDRGDTTLHATDGMADIFGPVIDAAKYLHDMQRINATIPGFRTLISLQAVDRLYQLTKRQWLRNSKGYNVGKALVWRVRQRVKAVDPADADILFVMGQTKATMKVLDQLKAKPSTPPILLSMAPSQFATGIFKLPAPWSVGARSFLRIDAVSRVQDIRVCCCCQHMFSSFAQHVFRSFP